MTRGSAQRTCLGGGEWHPACVDFFAREFVGTRISSTRLPHEGVPARRSRARLAGRLAFSPIDKVKIHAPGDLPATTVSLACALPEVLTQGVAGAGPSPDFLASDNVRIRLRPAMLTQGVAHRPEDPDFFATENVRVNAQDVRFCAPSAAKTEGAKTQFPTGRKFVKKILTQFPTGRNFGKNPLDISNVVII